MKKFLLYLERIDPYYTQRLILLKALYIATIMAYVAWCINIEEQFTAYMYPVALMAVIYENMIFTFYREKKHMFVLAFFLAIFGSILFYLTFQYKFIFIFVFLAFFNILYFLFSKFYPKGKPFIVLIIVVCCMNMSYKPSGVLQHSVDLFAVMSLSMLVSYFSIISFPNFYHRVWVRAFALYVSAIRNVLIDGFNAVDNKTFIAGTSHMNVMRAYRRLLKKNMFMKSTRAGFSIGNTFAILCCLDLTPANRAFWEKVNLILKDFHQSIKSGQPYLMQSILEYNEFDKVETYFIKNLTISIKNWNELCKLV